MAAFSRGCTVRGAGGSSRNAPPARAQAAGTNVSGTVNLSTLADKAELTLTDESDFVDVLRCYTAEHGGADLGLPLHETGLIETAHKICASYSMVTDKYFSLFHFRKIVSAFLKLKASRIPLIDGSLTVRVDGCAGREEFLITVSGGIPSVTENDEEPQIVLEHKEAEMFFFGLMSPSRTKCPLAAAWFPLPIRIELADQV